MRARYAAIYYPGENTRHAENAGRTERVELSRTVRVVVVVVVPSSKYAFSRKRPAENGKLQDRPWTGRARAVAVRAGPESGALITRPNLLGLSLFGGIPPRVPDDGYFDGFARAIVTADVPGVVEFVPFSNRRALDTSQYIPPPPPEIESTETVRTMMVLVTTRAIRHDLSAHRSDAATVR